MGTSYNTNVVSDGLIGCWDAGNRRSYPGAGTTWTDLVGSSNGSFVNNGGTSITFDSAKGGSLVFDGTDDYIDAGSNQILPSDRNPFTISLWLKPESGGDDWYTLYTFKQAVNQDGTDDYDFIVNWLATAYEGEVFYCGVRGMTSWGAGDNIGADRGDWHGKWCCVTITYNGEGTKSGHTYYSLYINDVNYALGSGGTIGGTRNANHIGGRLPYTNAHIFKGDMANLSVWNRALSAAEIKQNYEALKPRFTPRITKRGMNLNFDAGDPASYAGGTTWKDTANGLTTAPLTDHNMSASNFNSSNGGYFDFDGTDEYMSVVNSPLFQGAIADQGTFAAWFNIDAAETLSRDAPIWGAGSNGGTATWSMAQYHSSKKMHLYAKLGGGWSLGGDTDTALSYDTWYYVVFTWDKANTQVKSYVNGALDDTDSTSSVSITTSSTGWLGIGASLYSTSNGDTPFAHLNGFIGVLQLYDSVLSAAEISDNYDKTKARFGH